MKNLLSALLLVCLCNLVQAQEVTTTGFGSSYDEALQNAKISATEVAAGTFITGKRELVNGSYSESVGQYNGGIVRHVTVDSTVVTNGLYKVIIKAEVNLDKINRVIIPNTVAVSTHATDAVNDMHKTLDAWDAINNASHPFTIITDSAKFFVMDMDTVKVSYQFHAVWNPKWIDDAKKLVKVAGHSIDEKTRAIVCITRLGFTSYFDCDGVSAVPHEGYLPKYIKYAVIFHFKDGTFVQNETAEMGVYSNHTQTQSTYSFPPNRELMIINRDITVNEYRELTVSPAVADTITGITVEAIYPDNS